MVNISRASFNKIKELNGTVSGEHGDGRVRGQYIREQYGDEMFSLFLQVKQLFDPKDLMNPGIKVTEQPQNLLDNLRYGESYQKQTNINEGMLIHFQEAEWETEIEMCHGCSQCTTILPTTSMCPVYKGKISETASPKAKANALRAIISGKIDRTTAIKSPVKKELIFDCTGCQSCLVECPSNVNIPKMALQFKAEIVEENGQPRSEYLLGSFGLLGKILAPISFITNWIMNTRFSRWIGEKTFGITRYRKMPRFSRKSFQKWFNKNYVYSGKSETIAKVAFFIGCSANYVNPNIGKSLITVLQENNIEVVVPDQKCCGLPMYAYGNVKRGKKSAKYSIDKFLPLVRQGYDILVTCSSCGLSLKQEWYDLLGTPEAKEIANATYHFSEYLLKLKEKGALNQNFNEIDTAMSYHTPCHLKVQDTAKNASLELLEMIPNSGVKKINEGCCGICGSWGYKKENYDISMTIGNGLLEQLNSNSTEIGITDCPTCTLQMEHGSQKEILHPVEIIAMSYNPSE